jgi:fluoride exporter
MANLTIWIIVASGGALGTIARFAIKELFQMYKWSEGFPWHTFLVNLLGSFALGVVTATCHNRPNALLFLAVGFCGGFTTFSTFSLELLTLIEQNRFFAAALYMLGSVAFGLCGVYFGLKLFR